MTRPEFKEKGEARSEELIHLVKSDEPIDHDLLQSLRMLYDMDMLELYELTNKAWNKWDMETMARAIMVMAHKKARHELPSDWPDFFRINLYKERKK